MSLLSKREEVISILVYYDTIDKEYHGDDNLAEVFVPKSWLKEYVVEKHPEYESLADFLNQYICDEVDDLVDEATKDGKLIRTRKY